MNTLLDFFNINTIMFTVIGYPMSYIEFIGTILNIWCVWLTAKGKILSWPIGIVATVLFTALFYQIQLYSDLFEQVYFIITGFIGWYAWAKIAPELRGKDSDIRVGSNTLKRNVLWLVGIGIGTVLMTQVMGNIHLLLPMIFKEAASYPLLDAFTTVMSFAATILLIRRKLEAWYLWILVDIIGIGLYWVKDVKFIALEYVIFLIIATAGYLKWKKIYGERKEN